MGKPKTPRFLSVTRLWLLKHEVNDERFLQIFADFAGLIRRSERACEKAQAQGNPDYADFVVDSECDYLEEIIGASFVVLQAKIRRVQTAAAALAEFMQSQHGLTVKDLDRNSVFATGGMYQQTGASLIDLVWTVGNYYKHRDEWEAEVWEDKAPGEQETNSLRQSRATRKKAQKVGVIQFSTGNMRTAYEFFGIDPYSNCRQLAVQVQDWAKAVCAAAQLAVAAAHAAQPPRKRKP
jgi:hypothetical protein